MDATQSESVSEMTMTVSDSASDAMRRFGDKFYLDLEGNHGNILKRLRTGANALSLSHPWLVRAVSVATRSGRLFY